ncbi:MAG TPA: ATP-dependent DNA ligase, partial [Thermoanaerobaculia bacterium]|nr:ATP-dependent DNA ligase [Thermoanaerobaculia bacterium]
LADLVVTSRRVAATRSRSEKIAALADLLRRLGPEEIEVAAAFASGQLRQGRIGLGPAAVRAALADAPAAAAPALSLSEVDAAFAGIAGVAAAGGTGSTAERARRLGALLGAATREEQELLVRLIFGELRQGALAGLTVEALAAAAAVPAAEVRRALMLAGELAPVARAALLEGSAGLARFRLQLFRPLQPMLAQPAADTAEALERLGEAAFELKLDGARIQVHKAAEEVRVFSRLGNEVTAALPEVVEAVRALPARQLLLDGEAIALRPDGAPLPFQVTMRRFGRKLDVGRLRGELPLTPFLFDLLHLDGDDLIDRPARERFAALAGAAPGLTVPRLVTAAAGEAEAFFADVLRRGHEGLLAKAMDAPYEAGRRGASWLKIKPAHTLDLVVLAAEWGHGRRRGWLSNLHLGARDPRGGGFVMLGKTFKGLTDEMLIWQTERFRQLAVGGDAGADEWVVRLRPEVVVEVAFGDVQESPHYPGGMALRFARVKRFRPDKTAAEADTVDTVRAIFAAGRG